MKPGTPGFRGSRLKEAREARGISAASLADLAGVTPAAISQYEHGKQTPSPHTLRTIADRLNLPIPYFLSPGPEPAPSTVFYRSFTSATKTARLRAQRRYEWLRRIVGVLRRFVKFPVYGLPKVNLPDDWRTISPRDIEAAARDVRASLQADPAEPLPNVVLLLERAGVLTIRHALESSALDAFSNWPQNERNPFVVLGTDKISAVRSRFDAAHEVGHIVLHKNVSDRDLGDREVLRGIEDQANRFASALLLPADSFAAATGSPTLDRFLMLKTTWGVSVAAMIHRCQDLKLVDGPQAKRLWMNHARRGWKKREPYDDLIPPEEPRFIRRSLEIVFEKGLLSPQQLAHYVSLHPKDIEDVAGLPSGFLASSASMGETEVETIPFPQGVLPFTS